MNFDPNTFMSTNFGSVSDKVIPLPVEEYLAQVEKVGASSGTIGKGDRTGETWVRLDLTFKPIDEKSKQACAEVGLPHIPTVRYGIMLNLDEHGKLGTGDNENPKLGRLLKALQIDGEWVPDQLKGQVCIIKVGHNTNPETGDAYAEVTGVVEQA